jgi:predicted transcriptional regulator
MITDEAFVRLVDDFLTASGIPASVFCKKAIGDPMFYRDIKKGRSPTLKTANRILAAIEDYKASMSNAAE